MEDKGFEPLHDINRLTVFETVFSRRTWIIFRKICLYINYSVKKKDENELEGILF